MGDQKEEKKKLRPAGRYIYTEQYKMVMQTKADGTIGEEAVYIGPVLEAEHPAQVYVRVRRLALAASVFTMLAGILLLTVKGFAVYRGGLYALIPVTMSLFPAMYLILGARKLPAQDRKLQEDVRRLAHFRIRRSCTGIVVLYCAALLLTAVFFAVSGTAPAIPDLLYLVLTAGSPVMAGILLREMKKLKYRAPQ